MDKSRLSKAHDMIFGGNIFDKRAKIRRSTKEQAAEDNPMDRSDERGRKEHNRQEVEMGAQGRLFGQEQYEAAKDAQKARDTKASRNWKETPAIDETSKNKPKPLATINAYKSMVDMKPKAAVDDKMEEKAKQWLRDNPSRRYLMDGDSNDIDNYLESKGDNITDEDRIIEYGHRNGVLDKNYRSNPDSKWINEGGDDRSDEYVELKPMMDKERAKKAQELVFSGKAFKKKD